MGAPHDSIFILSWVDNLIGDCLFDIVLVSQQYLFIFLIIQPEFSFVFLLLYLLYFFYLLESLRMEANVCYLLSHKTIYAGPISCVESASRSKSVGKHLLWLWI